MQGMVINMEEAKLQTLTQIKAFLDGTLEKSLQRHHFSFDRRVYKPHVTLLRHVRSTDSPLPAMSAIIWEVKDFALVQSVGGAEGVRVEVLIREP